MVDRNDAAIAGSTPPGDVETLAGRRGPALTFDATFDTAFAAAYRAAYRLLGDRDDASECAQEALTRAYPRWERLARRGDPTPWVVRVAANLATDRRRRRRRDRSLPAGAPANLRNHDEGAVDRAVLHATLAHLSRRQHDVVILRYVADLSEADVAATLGISRGAVKQHASRGLAALRTQLEEH